MDYLPWHITYVPEELVEKAEIELGETPERKKEALAELRNFLCEDRKLICPKDDYYLLEFLRARKFNIKRTIALLHNFYLTKKNQKDIFGKTDFNIVLKVIRDKLVSVMPYRDADGAFIFIVQLRYWDVHETSFASILHAVIIILIGSVDVHPASQISGVKLIIDAKGVGLQYLYHMPTRLLFFIATGISNCLPLRIKAIHIINESVLIPYIWNLIKFLLADKLKKRIYFHSNSSESIRKVFDPALLPKDCGGTMDYDNSEFYKITEGQKNRYFELMSYGYKTKT